MPPRVVPSPEAHTGQEASAALREPLCPSLPPELWLRILSHHPDPIHLWATCRRLSRTFLAYTEQVFAEYHLRRASITFPLEKYNLGGQSRRPEAEVVYRRFEEGAGKARVFFGLKAESVQYVEIKMQRRRIGRTYRRSDKVDVVMKEDEVVSRWKDRIRESKPGQPGYLIRIGEAINDTFLPDMMFDAEKREISFRWRGMLSAFYREQLRLRELKKRWGRDSAKKLEENRKRLAKGEKLSVDDLPKSWASTQVELRKEIRRARLKEYYKYDDEMLWALDSLKYFVDYTTASTPRILPDIPGAGIGEPYFGSIHLLQSLYLDEWSSMHRIDTKVEHLAQELRN